MEYNSDSNFIDNFKNHTVGWVINYAYIKYVY